MNHSLLNTTTSYFNFYILFCRKAFPIVGKLFLLQLVLTERMNHMTEDLNKRIEQAAQGITPQTKPDERRLFLGSLRERVLVRLDNTEVKNSKLTALFLKHIDDFKGYTILINGNIKDDGFLGDVEAECSKKDIPFTLVNNETAQTGPNDTAVLVVAKTAINRPRIKINQVYPPEMPKTELNAPAKKHEGFWHHLFHEDK